SVPLTGDRASFTGRFFGLRPAPGRAPPRGIQRPAVERSLHRPIIADGSAMILSSLGLNIAAPSCLDSKARCPAGQGARRISLIAARARGPWGLIRGRVVAMWLLACKQP